MIFQIKPETMPEISTGMYRKLRKKFLPQRTLSTRSASASAMAFSSTDTKSVRMKVFFSALWKRELDRIS